MLKPLAAGLMGLGIVAFGMSFVGGQEADDADLMVIEEIPVVSAGAALEPETRAALDKMVNGLKDAVAQLQRERKTDAVAIKLKSIRALETFLDPGPRRAVVLRRDALPGGGVRNRTGDRDSTRPVADETAQQIAVELAAAAVKTAEQSVEIQKLQNESDIAGAQTRLELALLDLKKYTEGDFVHEKNVIAGEVQQAQEEVTRANDKQAATRELAAKDAGKQITAEADRVAAAKAQIKLALTNEKLRVLTEFGYPRQIAELKFAVAEHQRELKLAQLKAQANLARLEHELSTVRFNFEVAKAKLTQNRK